MTNKISSYQKQKLRIKKLEADVYNLRKMIAEEDYMQMRVVKTCFVVELNVEKMLWMGDRKNIGEVASGIIQQIKSDDHGC